MPRRSSTGSTPSVSRPSIKILPELGRTSRLIIRSVVVLPQPDGPSSTQVSPALTSSVTPSTAVTVPRGSLRSLLCNRHVSFRDGDLFRERILGQGRIARAYGSDGQGRPA